MTRQEFAQIAAGIRNLWPWSGFLPDASAMGAWYELISDLDYMATQAAIRKLAMTTTNPPALATIREAALEVMEGDGPDWGSGWQEVNRAISRYGMYREEEALNSMSEITRDTVKRLGFQNLCISENPEADRANFRNIFTAYAKQEKNKDVMSKTLKENIEEIRAKRREEVKRIDGESSREAICDSEV